MNKKTIKLSLKLKPLAIFFTYLLAIFGGLSLVMDKLNWVYKTITFKTISGIAKPILERYPFPIDSFNKTVSQENSILIGVSIMAQKTLSGTRVYFNYDERIIQWGIKSDALSPLEQREFISKLPIGDVSHFITPPLPDLKPDSITTIIAIAISSKSEIYVEHDLVEVSYNEGKLLHLDTTIIPIRGLTFFISIETLLLISFGLVSLIFFIKYIRKHKDKNIGSKMGTV